MMMAALAFLLPGNVPEIEFEWSYVGVDDDDIYFVSDGGNVFCPEISRRKPHGETGFTHSAVTDEDNLIFWHILIGLLRHDCNELLEQGWQIFHKVERSMHERVRERSSTVAPPKNTS